MKTEKEIITAFYTAFKNLNSEAMVALYSDKIVFEDPAFGQLTGERAKNMWRMLVGSQKDQDFIVEFTVTGDLTASWEAKYLFSKTGRKVHNKIEAQFEIQDGLIVKHTDVFDLHKWAKQALGFKGLMLGGTSFFKKKLQAQTNHLLNKYEAQSS